MSALKVGFKNNLMIGHKNEHCIEQQGIRLDSIIESK